MNGHRHHHVLGFLTRAFIVRNLMQNKLRLLLTILGIMLGVAILLAINLANHTSLERFKQSLDLVAGQTNLEISPVAAYDMDETLLFTLPWVWEKQGHFTPVIVQTAVPADGSRHLIYVLGVDMLADFRYRPFEWETTGQPGDPLDILKRNRVYVGHSFAKQNQLKIGNTLNLLIHDRQQSFEVAGILAEKGLSAAYDGNFIMMDIATAQTVFHMPGRINRVDLIVPTEQRAQVQQRLKKELPPGLQVTVPERQGQQAEKMLKAFQLNLMALSFIALLVAMFLIYNTMSISIIRRRTDIGTLRALGTARWQIMALFLSEALVQGIAGSLLGCGFGVFLATQAIKGVSSTVEILYTGMAVSGVEISGPILLQAFLLGVGLTVLSALPPVLEAASVSPAEATRRGSFESKVQNLSAILPVISLILWGLAYWAAQQPSVDGFPIYGHTASLLTVLGVALVMPWFLKYTLRLLKRPMKGLFGAEGRLAVENLQGALARTSVAVASLMVAIAMTVSLAVMIGSFRTTVKAWVQQSIQADIWIEPLWRKLNAKRRINPEVSKKIRSIEGIAYVDNFLEFPIEYNGQPANIAVGEFDVFAKKGNLQFLDGEATRDVMNRALKEDAVIVTETFAYHHHLKKGDTVTLETPQGPLTRPIAGIYYDYASEHGYIVMPWTLYRQHYEGNLLSGIAIYLEKGVQPETVRAEISQRLDNQTGLNIVTQQGLRQEVIRIFDQTFAITYALHVISITVALLGIMNALFALVLESRRDFGILKYLGATVQQIRRIVLIEAGLLGFLGNLAGLAVGFALSFLLINVINRQSFGWTIQFHWPLDFLVQTFALIMITAIISGLFPAHLAGKTLAPNALRDE